MTVHTVNAAMVQARTVAIQVSSVAVASRETSPDICDQRTAGSSCVPSWPKRSPEFCSMVRSADFTSAARTGLKSDSCRSVRPVCAYAPSD